MISSHLECGRSWVLNYKIGISSFFTNINIQQKGVDKGLVGLESG